MVYGVRGSHPGLRYGLGFVDPSAVLATDLSYSAPVADPGTLVAPTPSGTTAPTTTPTGVVAMPATTTTTTAQPLDGSAPLSAPMTAADGTVIPAGSTVIDTQTAQIVTYPDGSSRIIYKNAPPPNDPECVKYDTSDLNRGLICQMDEQTGRYVYIPTESWTGKIQSWGELKANLTKAVQLNPKFPEAARHAVLYRNPAWHFVIGGPATPDGKYRTQDGTSLAYQIELGRYGVIGYPDSFVPESVADFWIHHWAETLGRPLTAAEEDRIRTMVANGQMPDLNVGTPIPEPIDTGAKMYVVDPDSGERIDVTSSKDLDPNAPITSTGKSLNDLVYGPVDQRSPGQPGYTPPVYVGPPINDNGVVIDNGGIVPPRGGPGGGGGVPAVNVSDVPSAVAPNGAMLALGALGLLLFLKRKR